DGGGVRSIHFFRLASYAALITTTFDAYEMPSAASVTQSLDEKFGGMTPEILKSGATVIAGDYWTVWPSVFHANLRSYRQTRHTEIYGLTYRSAVTDDLWVSRPSNLLIAAAPG